MNSYAYQLRARVAIIWTTLPVCANWHSGKPLTVNTEKTNKASLSSPLLYPPILLFFLLQTFLFQSYFIQIPSCVCLPHVAVCTLATWKVNVAMFYFETAFRSIAFLNKDRKYHHKSLQRTTNANKLCTVCYLTPNYATEGLILRLSLYDGGAMTSVRFSFSVIQMVLISSLCALFVTVV